MIEITPDWTMVRTARAAEAEFVDFQWMGPGWYVSKTGQTMLAMPLLEGRIPSSLWEREYPTEQQFVFLSFSAPPFKSFDAVALAPIRRIEIEDAEISAYLSSRSAGKADARPLTGRKKNERR